MNPCKVTIKLDFDWPTYEDEIRATVQEAITDEIRQEAIKFAKGLRQCVRKKLIERQGEWIDRTITELNKKGKL